MISAFVINNDRETTCFAVVGMRVKEDCLRADDCPRLEAPFGTVERTVGVG
jgi:hypothetical protein